jgi:ribonuclease T1
MSKTGRRLADAEVPLPRGKMIPLLLAVVVVAAISYFVERNKPPAGDPAPVAQQEEAAKQEPAARQESAKPQATVSTPREPAAGSGASPKSTATLPDPASEPPLKVLAGATAGGSSFVVRNQVLKDQDGEVIYRGDVNLQMDISRIASGRQLRFPNDGSTFQNREGRLPKHPAGYYREWVVPTKGVGGPGPQRIVTGGGGEVWYTPDHYKTFRRMPAEIKPHSAAPPR